MKWEDMLSRVLPFVDGCPDELAIQHLIYAAREFCEGTHIWQYETDPVMSEAERGTYVFQIGDDEEIVKVDLIQCGSDEYKVSRAAAGRAAARRGSGQTAFISGTGEFTLVPAPAQSDIEIRADVVVQPSLESTGWPDDLNKYVGDICNGAIATLCTLPKQDWNDAVTAATYRTLFTDRISTVGWQISLGQGSGAEQRRIRNF